MTVVANPESRPRVAGVPTPDDHVVVLFGATGDLAKRKLLPGLFHLFEAGLLPAGYRIVGTSRRPRWPASSRRSAPPASPRTRA